MISESFNLMLGDCLERMKEIPDGSVDLTVTSPPYDNLRTYNNTLNDWNADKWQAILGELFRVTKTGGVLVWNVADATVNGSETGTSFRQALYAMECGFNLHDTMVWVKDGGGAVGSNKCYIQNFEYMFVFSKGHPQSVNLIYDKPNASFGKVKSGVGRRTPDGALKIEQRKPSAKFSRRNNWWYIPPERGEHPAVFPIALPSDHIISWSDAGDTVFDPFLGSGTTGVAALSAGRKFIGIERDPTYFDIARRRIETSMHDVILAAHENDNNPMRDIHSAAFRAWLMAV